MKNIIDSKVTFRFVAVFRAHVEAVYQIAWSADSRMFVSCSRDSTIKVWDVKTKKLKGDLPGHADEVNFFDRLIVVGVFCRLVTRRRKSRFRLKG